MNEEYPFLGATPDVTVYDLSNLEQPFGFLEVKCPYFHRDCTPLEACFSPGFCCTAQLHSNQSQTLQLRHSHTYFAQVQGQIAVGERAWCDFVVYAQKGISVKSGI